MLLDLFVDRLFGNDGNAIGLGPDALIEHSADLTKGSKDGELLHAAEGLGVEVGRTRASGHCNSWLRCLYKKTDEFPDSVMTFPKVNMKV